MNILTILTVMVVSFGLGVFRGERKVVQMKRSVKTEIMKIRQTSKTIQSLKKQLANSKVKFENILQTASKDSEKCELDILRLNNEIERLEERNKNLEYGNKDNLNVDREYIEDINIKEVVENKEMNGENYKNEQ